MADTLTINKLVVDFGGKLTTSTALVPFTIPLVLKEAIDLAAGTGADAANLCYMAEATLAATTAVNYDLSGALVTPSGAACVFTKFRALIIYLHPGTNMGPLRVGGHATAAVSTFLYLAASDFNTAQPAIIIGNGASGGLLLLTRTDVTGYAVTNSSADQLTLYNAGSATCTFDIVILGA